MFYRHWLGVTYTEGVSQMAEDNGAWWLVDAIASHVVANQRFKAHCQKDEMFRDMQIWILQQRNGGADLIAVADTTEDLLANPIVKQEITFTDFPFDATGKHTLYCARNFVDEKPVYTILEPSEY